MANMPISPKEPRPTDTFGDSLTRVYTAEHEMEAALMQSLIEHHGIWAIVQGQNLKMIQGSVPVTEHTYPSLWVRSSDASKARQVIQQHKNRPRPLRSQWKCPGCGEGIEEQFTHCWNCGAAPDDVIEPLPVIPLNDEALDYCTQNEPLDDPDGVGFHRSRSVDMAGVRLNGVMPEMPVKDVAAAVRFYCDVLQMKAKFSSGDPAGYAIVARDEVQIALLGAWSGARPGTGRCYVFTSGIDEYYSAIEAAGANIVDELATRPYGMRDFAMTDPDGNRLAFGEEV